MKENYEISVKAYVKGSYSNSNDNLLYQNIYIAIPPEFKNKTHCKYIFNYDSNFISYFEFIGLKYDNFPSYNDSAYIYDGLCPNGLNNDFFSITPRQVT